VSTPPENFQPAGLGCRIALVSPFENNLRTNCWSTDELLTIRTLLRSSLQSS